MDMEEALERARSSTQAVGQRLMAALGGQPGSGTPTTAVSVCSEIARAMASEMSRGGVEIRQTSLRYRNPDTTPDQWERNWLERLAHKSCSGARLDHDSSGKPCGRRSFHDALYTYWRARKCRGTVDPVRRKGRKTPGIGFLFRTGST